MFAKGKTAFSVIITTGSGVGVSRPVTGRSRGPVGLGTSPASICLASATAVLFISTKERSWVLRACKSMAVGGAGFMPASKNTIHAMPVQSTSAAKPCRGAENFFIN